MTEYQLFLATEKPEIPPNFILTQLEGLWLASDKGLPRLPVRDAKGRDIGLLIGFVYSDARGEFLPDEPLVLDTEVGSTDDLERDLLGDLSGLFVFLSRGSLPQRLYLDHTGGLPLVYSAADRRAATSPALLLDEDDYRTRFWSDLHDVMIRREGRGWISGTLTAHQGVFRVLPHHYLDLQTWSAHRYWPRAGEFERWRDFDQSVMQASRALTRFAEAASRRFRVASALTAGFDTRMLTSACRTSLDRISFFTLTSGSPIDVEMSQVITRRHGLKHILLPEIDASEPEMIIWDRMVGDCLLEATRNAHTTLRQLDEQDAVFTGMYGEVGRCRLYRQDFTTINKKKIDAHFVLGRLTIPAHPAQVKSVSEWLEGLEGQPPSVILDLAFHELKFGNWAMAQGPITNTIKLNLLPMGQRAVLDAFIGVAPAEKTTQALFSAIIRHLWPDLMETPINKYGDLRDQLSLLKKLGDPQAVRRALRDRLARSR